MARDESAAAVFLLALTEKEGNEGFSNFIGLEQITAWANSKLKCRAKVLDRPFWFFAVVPQQAKHRP